MGKNNKRKTTQEFKQEVFDLVGSEYIVNEEYVNASTKISFIHNIASCMNEFYMTPTNFTQGQRCPKCRQSERKQRDLNWLKINGQRFCEEVFDVTDGEYIVIGEYLGSNKKIDILHTKCDEIFSMTPIHFKRGHRCTNTNCIKMCHSNGCAIGKGSSFYERFKEFSGEYELLDEYRRWNSTMTFKHKICDCVFKMTPNSFFNLTNNIYGIKCPECLKREIYKNRAKTKEQFQKEIDKISNNEYIVLGEYVNNITPVLMKHIKCNNTWKAKPNNLLSGTGCPYCKFSKGERKIELYLDENNFSYKPQWKFNDLIGVGHKLLSYDFYLPDYNLLIEYQGEYHDGTVSYQTIEDFKIQQEHDKRKREYAQSHGIQLLEIWYWDFDNIENILYETLNENQKVS